MNLKAVLVVCGRNNISANVLQLTLRYLYIKIKTMSKEMRKYIDTFKQRILKENEELNENDTTEYVDCLDSLKKLIMEYIDRK